MSPSPNVKGLLSDPQFQALDPAAQKQALGRVDPSFSNLSDEQFEQFKTRMGTGLDLSKDQPVYAPASTRSLVGMGSNIVNNAYAGAKGGGTLGGFIGGLVDPAGGEVPGAAIGATVGGLGGGIAGFFQKPSDHPLVDLGATAASALLGGLPQPAGNLGRFTRGTSQVLGTVGGSLLGSKFENTTGLSHETPYGRILVYGGAAGLAGALGSFASDASPAKQAVNDAKNLTGVQYPLNVPESTGRFNLLKQLFLTGSQTDQNTARLQTQAAQATLEHVTGVPMSDAMDIVMKGTNVKQAGKDVVRNWVKQWYSNPANKIVTEIPQEGNIIDPSTGQKVMTTVSKVTQKPPDWNQFATDTGLTAKAQAMGIDPQTLKDEFFRSLKTEPGKVVDQFFQNGENRTAAALKFRAMMTVLHNTPGAQAQEAGAASAFVERQLGGLGGPFKGPVLNGEQFYQRVMDGAEGLKDALLPDQVTAVQKIAQAARDANPLPKFANQSGGEAARAITYLGHKVAFGAVSGGMVAGGEGYHKGGMLGAGLGFVVGAAGGAMVVLPLDVAMRAALASPRIGTLLINASKGDQTAATALIRSISAPQLNSGDDLSAAEGRSRLAGLFKK